MTNGSGSLAGAAIGVAFAGIALGVTGNVVKQTNRQLKRKKTKSRGSRLRRTGII